MLGALRSVLLCMRESKSVRRRQAWQTRRDKKRQAKHESIERQRLEQERSERQKAALQASQSAIQMLQDSEAASSIKAIDCVPAAAFGSALPRPMRRFRWSPALYLALGGSLLSVGSSPLLCPRCGNDRCVC